jgi:amino acid permease
MHLLLYGTLVAVFFAVLLRRRLSEQLRLGAFLFLGMVGGALALAYLMFPFPR